MSLHDLFLNIDHKAQTQCPNSKYCMIIGTISSKFFIIMKYSLIMKETNHVCPMF